MTPTNVRHIPWVPVIGQDGRRRTLTLQQTLEQAPTLADLGTDHPVERSALLRFLTSAAALVLREAGIREYTATEQWPSTHVAAALDRIDDTLDLRHPTKPFAQEWDATTTAAPNAQPMSRFPWGTPGPDTRTWKDPSAFTDRSNLTLGDVARHLVVRWFHNFGGNGPSINTGISMGNGSIGAALGNDTALFWQGRTLADTLAANTMRTWVDSDELPSWADRTARTAGKDLGGLWHNTFNCNTVLLLWDDNGHPTQWLRGRSRHQAPSISQLLPGKDGVKSREAAKVVYDDIKLADPYRLTVLDNKGNATKFTPVLPDHGHLQRLKSWYVGAAQGTLTKRARASITKVDLSRPEWGLAAFTSRYNGDSKSPAYIYVDWVDLSIPDYELPTPAHLAASSVFDSLDQHLSELKKAVVACGFERSGDLYLRSKAVSTFWELADAAAHQVMDDIQTYRKAGKVLRDRIGPLICEAFDLTLAPFSRNPSTKAQVIAERSALSRRLRNLSTKDEQ